MALLASVRQKLLDAYSTGNPSALIKVMNDNGVSAADIAREFGLDPSVVNAYLTQSSAGQTSGAGSQSLPAQGSSAYDPSWASTYTPPTGAIPSLATGVTGATGGKTSPSADVGSPLGTASTGALATAAPAPTAWENPTPLDTNGDALWTDPAWQAIKTSGDAKAVVSYLKANPQLVQSTVGDPGAQGLTPQQRTLYAAAKYTGNTAILSDPSIAGGSASDASALQSKQAFDQQNMAAQEAGVSKMDPLFLAAMTAMTGAAFGPALMGASPTDVGAIPASAYGEYTSPFTSGALSTGGAAAETLGTLPTATSGVTDLGGGLSVDAYGNVTGGNFVGGSIDPITQAAIDGSVASAPAATGALSSLTPTQAVSAATIGAGALGVDTGAGVDIYGNPTQGNFTGGTIDPETQAAIDGSMKAPPGTSIGDYLKSIGVNPASLGLTGAQMALGAGLLGSILSDANKTKQTTTTTMPAPYIQGASQNLINTAGALAPTLTSLTPNQVQAMSLASGTAGGTQPLINQSRDLTTAGSSPITEAQIAAGMNPYLDLVANRVTTAGQNMRNRVIAQAARSGNDIAGTTPGTLNQSDIQASLADRTTLDALGQVYAGGYNTALQSAQQTAARQLTGGTNLTGLANTQQANTNTQIGNLSSTGALPQTVASGGLLALGGALNQASAAAPRTVTTTLPPPSLTGQLVGAAGALNALGKTTAPVQ